MHAVNKPDCSADLSTQNSAMMASTSGSTKVKAKAKAKKTLFDQINLGAIATLEEMDKKVLVFQNRKLQQRLDFKKGTEAELKLRIEQLEKRQTNDDAVLCIVNRHWNQLNEDIRLMLQRFDSELADDIEASDSTTSFLNELSSWNNEELDEKLIQRVDFTKRIIGKLLQAFDRLSQRENDISKMLKGDAAVAMADDEEAGALKLEDGIKKMFVEVQGNNNRLHTMVTQLHQRYHSTMESHDVFKDRLTAAETENAELKNKIEDMCYDLEKTRCENDKFRHQLEEAVQKMKTYGPSVSNPEGSSPNIVKGIPLTNLDEFHEDLEEQRELATNRLQELEKLQKEHEETLKRVESLKMELNTLPDSVIMETPQYQCLQSQFSVLYNETMQIETQLNEAKMLNLNSRTSHLKQIEQMEVNELEIQKKLRNENMQLEEQLAIIRREYEMLRIEFEQSLCAQEQTGPMNREMRHIITSLQAKNQQITGDNARYRHRLKEATNEAKRLKNEVDNLRRQHKSGDTNSGAAATTPGTSHHTMNISSPEEEKAKLAKKEMDIPVKRELDQEEGEVAEEDERRGRMMTDVSGRSQPASATAASVKREGMPIKKEVKGADSWKSKGENSSSSNDSSKDLQAQLKKAQIDNREMKLLLDMYRSAPKEQRDKAQMMAAERKAKQECEELRSQLRKLKEQKEQFARKLQDEEHVRKMSEWEGKVKELQKTVASMKGEEDILLDELDKTGHALDQVQEQNNRLLEQLREKDECNFKLMSERIKANQVHQLLTEEKEIVVQQNQALKAEISKQSEVLHILEEKEKMMQATITCLEKEMNLRQQGLDMHKKKAIECAQSAQDLQLHLNKYQTQLREAQSVIAEKTSALHQESFKYKRIQEELNSAKRKLERAKKIELAGSADEILLEEMKEYKAQLTCPSCKCKRKDAVLTKCFHVFCFECIRTRYETRQRKCPKCNAAFGANDFHRIYLD